MKKKRSLYIYAPSVILLALIIFIIIFWSSINIEKNEMQTQIDICNEIIKLSDNVTDQKDLAISQLQSQLEDTELELYRLQKENRKLVNGKTEAEQTIAKVDEYIEESTRLADLFQQTENWKYAFQTLYIWDKIIEKENDIIYNQDIYNETIVNQHKQLKEKISNHKQFLENVTSDLFCTPFSTMIPDMEDNKKIVDIS